MLDIEDDRAVVMMLDLRIMRLVDVVKRGLTSLVSPIGLNKKQRIRFKEERKGTYFGAGLGGSGSWKESQSRSVIEDAFCRRSSQKIKWNVQCLEMSLTQKLAGDDRGAN